MPTVYVGTTRLLDSAPPELLKHNALNQIYNYHSGTGTARWERLQCMCSSDPGNISCLNWRGLLPGRNETKLHVIGFENIYQGPMIDKANEMRHAPVRDEIGDKVRLKWLGIVWHCGIPI